MRLPPVVRCRRTVCFTFAVFAGCAKETKAPADPGDPSRVSAWELDTRPIPQRIEELMGAHFELVTLPADDISRSTDATHPDVVRFAHPWNGVSCVAGYTPYLRSDAHYENPSMVVCDGHGTWSLVPGARNPIVTRPDNGYNSDDDLVFDPSTNRLIMTYREVTDGLNKIKAMSTSDGKRWTKAKTLFAEKNHDAVSQSVVVGASREVRYWYVRTGEGGCSARETSVAMRTARPIDQQLVEDAPVSDAQTVSFVQPGQILWHQDVAPLQEGGGYVALQVDYQAGQTCTRDDLWLAVGARDGLAFETFDVPVLWRTMALARNHQFRTWYRGSIAYDPSTDIVDFWPSAFTFGGNWVVGHTWAPLTQLLWLLRRATPSDYAQMGLLNLSPVYLTMPLDARGDPIEMP